MSDEGNLQLDFVYGYHGSRCRDNLFYTSTGEIVYHIAGVGIVYNSKKHTQRFFLGHTDDIISLTIHPNKKYVATGQIGKEPYIAIWDTETMETVALCKGFHQRGIAALGFSHEGDYLVSIGLDDSHTIAIWDWKAGRVIANDKASQDRLFDIQLSPYNNTIVTAGVKHVKFWKYSGNTLVSNKGIFGTLGTIQTILCINFGHADNFTYTGTLNGEVYIWQENKLVKVVKAHKGPLYAITPFPEGFLTGGKDGTLRIWSKDFTAVTSVVIGQNYNLRSIDYENGKILIGTKSSEIFEVVYNGKDKPNPVLLIEGHGEGELWGLGSHPTKHLFATASDDKLIKIWNGDSHKCVLTIPAKFEARSCGFSPDGNHLAVGFLNGSFAVHSVGDGKELFAKKDRKEEISAIRYSPDGKYIAVGSHDNFVDIYDATKFTRIGTCQGSSSYITHLDWSTNSKIIQTNSGAYEHLYYEVPSCTRLTTKMDNVQWATWSCVLGKNVAGIWPPYSDKTDVNSVDKGRGDHPYLVTGDDFGFVKLFKYPTPEGAKFKKYPGHSAHVTNVTWSYDNSYVVSIGGGDQAVLQWRVTKAGEDPTQEQTFNETAVHEEFDSDIEREKAVPDRVKSKPPLTNDVPEPMFSVEEEIQAFAAPPSVARASGTKGRPTKKPKSGETVQGHIDPVAPPQKNLTLDFIFGYRGFDTRDNLFYTKNGEIVYHTAATGIVYNPQTHTQRFFIGQHTDDILCLAIDQSGKLIATGEIGHSPKICVWDATTLECLAVLKGFHERGVTNLSFNGDSTQLITVGLDDAHSVALYEWRSGTKIASDKGSQDKIFNVQFNPHAPEFVTVGIKHVKFWKVAGNGFVSKQGVFGQKGTLQTILSIGFDKEFTYTGTTSGEIYKWRANQLEESIPAHTGPVFTIYSNEKGFATGGKDGKIILWGPGFKQQQTIDVNKIQTEACLRSLCWKDSKVLIGTRDGDVMETTVSSGEVKYVIGGHGMGELWGLATHPSKTVFATVSDDKALYIWDIATKKMITDHPLKKQARSVTYSPDGQYLAIGFITGKFSVLKADTLEEIATHTNRKEAIHEIKFSPNGKYLAVGSHDNFVDIYHTSDKWQRVCVCTGSSSYITHVDWNAESDLITTNSGAYERLFYQIPSGKRITINAAAEQNINWSSWTGVLGDQVAGIWPKFSDGTDVNAVDRSHNGELLATADDFGLVKLFPWPATDGVKHKEYRGHSAHVTNVRFSHNDHYLISIGGGDTAVFVWSLGHNEERDDDTAPIEEHYDSDVERETKIEYISRAAKMEEFQKDIEIPSEDGGFGITLDTTADVVRSAAPRKGVAKSDHEYVQHDNESVSHITKSLELDFIHGYRGHDTRNNLWYLDSGEIVYHSAATGIVYNPKTNTQRFFLEHTDDIVSLAYHAPSGMVATGQVGKQPTIMVWNTKTMKSESIIKGFHSVAVSALAFSKSGKFLVSVGLDNDHSVAVYDWKKGILVSSQKGAPEKIFDVSFVPESENEFVTVGVKHVVFWKVVGNQMESNRGIFGNVGTQTTMLSVAFAQNGVYSGAITGEIYHWVDKKLTRVIKAGDGAIYTINPTPKGDFLVGGKDEKVIRYGPDFGAVKDTIKLPRNAAPFSIRSITENKEGKIILGTSNSEIYEIGADKKPRLHVQGHGDGELWGLALHPNKHVFVTAGDDKTVRVWDIAQHNLISLGQLSSPARSVDVSPDGKKIAVGYDNGGFSVHEYGSLKEITKKRSRKEAVHEIKFSPDGKYLAVGSHDNFVDIYSTDDYKLLGVCKGNSSYITHLDWTKDSAFIQTNSGAYEHLLYEAPTGKHITDRKLTEKLHRWSDWQSWTGVLGDLVDGIWPKGSDKTDINSLDTTKTGTILATGDDFGFVKLFEYPCKQRGAEFKKFAGHSAHVTNVRFNFDDTFLISTGGGDRTIFQWKLK